jgi:hypothetical protein
MPHRALLLPPLGHFNEILFLITLLFFIVLVVCSLESPSELLALTRSLPSPQSSRWGRRRQHIGRFLRQEVEERVGKQKTPNPQKRKNKSTKQTKKEGE